MYNIQLFLEEFKNNKVFRMICTIYISIFTFILIACIILFCITNVIMEKDIKYVQITIDEFFEKYNNKNFEYICENMYSEYSINNKGHCYYNLNEMYNSYGKEISYELSMFKSRVYIYNGTRFKFSIPTKYEKTEKRYTNLDIMKEKDNTLKIYTIKTSSNITPKNDTEFIYQYH